MEEEDLYDEFGNLVGGNVESDTDSSSDSDGSANGQPSGHHELGIPADSDDETPQHSPRQQPSDPSELLEGSLALSQATGNQVGLKGTFGPKVETIIVKPTAGGQDEAVIRPEKEKKLRFVLDSNLPELVYSREYMLQTMQSLPERIRNIAIVGNFHSGKTSLVDLFVYQTHTSLQPPSRLKSFKPLRYLDNHVLEVDRGMTIKLNPLSLLLPDQNGKSFIFNMIDTPGHFDFADETAAALDAVEGSVFVLDAVEGLTPRDRSLISMAMKKNLAMTFVLNKIDRLILELRLPPGDCYLKLKYIVDDIISCVENHEHYQAYEHKQEISPLSGHFLFAAASYGFCFSLGSFAALYGASFPDFDAQEFSQRLWGDWYFDSASHTLTTKPQNSGRTFVGFVLEPLYKLFASTLTSKSSGDNIAGILWSTFGIELHKSKYKQDSQILLREVLSTVFGMSSFVDMVSLCVSPPRPILSGGVLAHVVKLIEHPDGQGFDSLVRIHRGVLSKGQTIKVYGDNYAEDDENCRAEIVDSIHISGGRYSFEVEEANEGSIVLVKGIDSIITKTGTVAENDNYIFPARNYSKDSVFKVAIEPYVPNDLPKMLDGLRKVSRSYLACTVKVEDSGEHLVFGTGELYLDCVLHDLRNFFTDDLEIKVSDPIPKFSETCSQMSFTAIPTEAGDNSLSIIAEPLGDDKVSIAVENGTLNLHDDIKAFSSKIRTEYGWDALSARSVWCFGPDDLQKPSVLMDDTLSSETDKTALNAAKAHITLGFKWCANEGPLCDEPIRNTKFKILDAAISGSEVSRGGARLIPLSRKACYAGFLTGSPRLMEPYYRVHGTGPHRAIRVFASILAKRRGYVEHENPVPGTALFQIEGLVPVIEAVGLESEIRLNTQGQAMCFLVFDRWSIVPGDPLDPDVPLPTLEPVPDESLARDFVLKTRRRKGLSGEPSLQKYVDGDLYQSLKDNGLVQ